MNKERHAQHLEVSPDGVHQPRAAAGLRAVLTPQLGGQFHQPRLRLVARAARRIPNQHNLPCRCSNRSCFGPTQAYNITAACVQLARGQYDKTNLH